VDYPTDKATLIRRAKDNGAGDDVIQPLKCLPGGPVHLDI
jgi:hypothetical protein